MKKQISGKTCSKWLSAKYRQIQPKTFKEIVFYDSKRQKKHDFLLNRAFSGQLKISFLENGKRPINEKPRPYQYNQHIEVAHFISF